MPWSLTVSQVNYTKNRIGSETTTAFNFVFFIHTQPVPLAIHIPGRQGRLADGHGLPPTPRSR